MDKPAIWAIVVYVSSFIGRTYVRGVVNDPKYQYYYTMMVKNLNTEFMDIHAQVYSELYGHVGLMFIAMIVIQIVFYILMLFKGTDGPNRYGQDPLKIHSVTHRDRTKHFDERQLFSRH